MTLHWKKFRKIIRNSDGSEGILWHHYLFNEEGSTWGRVQEQANGGFLAYAGRPAESIGYLETLATAKIAVESEVGTIPHKKMYRNTLPMHIRKQLGEEITEGV